MESLHFAACLLSVISLLLLIIALASDYWAVGSNRNIHSGLWRNCTKNNCVSVGMKVLYKLTSYIHATRIFMLIGMIAGAATFFGFCASFCHTHIGSISMKCFAMLSSFGAGVCSLIAMSTFTAVHNDMTLFSVEKPFGWSFAIGWTSVPLFLITGGLAYNMVSSTTYGETLILSS